MSQNYAPNGYEKGFNVILFFTTQPNSFLPYKIYERVENEHNQKKEDFLKIVTKRDFRNVRYIEQFMIHPDFKPSTKFPDLAILMLAGKFKFRLNPFSKPNSQKSIPKLIQKKDPQSEGNF